MKNSASYNLESSVILGVNPECDGIKIVGESGVWSFKIKRDKVRGVTPSAPVLFHREVGNRYAYVRGEGYEIVEASYSKGAVALKVLAKEEGHFSLIVGNTESAFKPVMKVDNRLWYAYSPTSGENGKANKKSAESGSTDTRIDKCVVEFVGLNSEVTTKGDKVKFTLGAGEEVYLYVGVGQKESERAPKLNELKNGIDARTLNYSLNTPLGQGGGLGELGRVLPQIYGYKDYDEDMGALAYRDKAKDADMERRALVGVLAGDYPYNQIFRYAEGGLLTALNTWITFARTRNHSFLEKAYALLKKNNPLGGKAINSKEDFIIYDIMERASRVLLYEKDNALLLPMVEGARDRFIATTFKKGAGSSLDCLVDYLLLVMGGSIEGVTKLRAYALERYNALEKSLDNYLYYLIALSSSLDVNFYSNDIRPALNFGSLLNEDFRLSNFTIWNRKISTFFSRDSGSLTVDGVKVLDIIGSNAYVQDFKEEIGGVSLVLSLSNGATITIISPPFSNNKPKTNPYKLRLESGKYSITIKNNGLKVEKL